MLVAGLDAGDNFPLWLKPAALMVIKKTVETVRRIRDPRSARYPTVRYPYHGISVSQQLSFCPIYYYS